MRLKAPAKYRAVPTVVEGIRFHSKREAARYLELRLLEKTGEIDNLILQPRFALCSPDWRYKLHFVNAADNASPLVGEYVADFQYRDKARRIWVVEDVKGFKTPLYRWKKKHVELQYGITIREA